MFRLAYRLGRPMGNTQVRRLHLHEYQSMRLMKQYGVNTPAFAVACTPDEAEAALQVDGPLHQYKSVVVKAQVLTGGRALGHFKENGYQGGVHMGTSPQDIRSIAENMLNNTLITKQTSVSGGRPCLKVLLAERLEALHERYFAILMDRSNAGPLLIGSCHGGTSIEDIAEKHPESIVKLRADITRDISESDLIEFIKKMKFNQDAVDKVLQNIQSLYKMFMEKDCSLLEINPMLETKDGRILVCDAKVTLDDNANFRQKEIFAQKDESQEDPQELHASRLGLNYISLDGSIGCIVNGAGLAMATMDILQLHGGKPANFLDVGGGAAHTQIVEALRMLQLNPKVKVVFVNIFGGIMRCDIIAQGIVSASSTVQMTKPLLVRLEGTNKEKARDILNSSGINIILENNFNDAAKIAVRLSNSSENTESV